MSEEKKAKAAEFKTLGNKSLQAGKLSEAIDYYTKAIDSDGTNHIYYSNRSAAYLKKGDATLALEDADACIGLNSNFVKGYSRKGAALHTLHRYNDSIAVYKEALEKFPDDKGLKDGLASVEAAKAPAPANPGSSNFMNGIFGPNLVNRVLSHPKLCKYASDQSFMEKLRLLQTNPNNFDNTMLGDPKIMDVFQVLLNESLGNNSKSEPFSSHETPPPSSSETKPKEDPKVEEKEVMEESDEDEDLSPAEFKKRQDKKNALNAKTRGNAFYKQKKFAESIEAYDEAIALDPTNMTYLSNKAAVYFMMKEWDKCIETSVEAVEVGKTNLAPYEERAKALTRAGKAYQKKDDLPNAIKMLKDSLLECHDRATQRLLKNIELEKKKADTMSYQDDAKAEEAKQRGNEHFRAKKWSEAVKEYEDAVKRAPKNPAIRNNLSAALCKIMDFNGALTQVQKAVELDPTYVKAWARKGDVEVMMKENHKALSSYRKGLELDPNNVACKQGFQKVNMMINSTGSESKEDLMERQKKAMADPEIQSILTDPVMRQILQDFEQNPQAAQEAMRNPAVRTKLEMLVAAGVIQMG